MLAQYLQLIRQSTGLLKKPDLDQAMNRSIEEARPTQPNRTWIKQSLMHKPNQQNWKYKIKFLGSNFVWPKIYLGRKVYLEPVT